MPGNLDGLFRANYSVRTPRQPTRIAIISRAVIHIPIQVRIPRIDPQRVLAHPPSRGGVVVPRPIVLQPRFHIRPSRPAAGRWSPLNSLPRVVQFRRGLQPAAVAMSDELKKKVNQE